MKKKNRRNTIFYFNRRKIKKKIKEKTRTTRQIVKGKENEE